MTKGDKDVEKAYLFIGRGTIVSLKVSIIIRRTVTVEVFQYRVLGVYKNIYKKWFMNGNNQKWHVKME